MSDFDQEIIKEFLVESFEGLGGVERDLLLLEKNSDDPDLLGSIFRCIHSIKGACGFLGFGQLEMITHVGEGLLSQLRDGREVTPEIIDALLSMVDAVTEVLTSIQNTDSEGTKEYEELMTTLKDLEGSEDEASEEEDLSALMAQLAADKAAEGEAGREKSEVSVEPPQPDRQQPESSSAPAKATASGGGEDAQSVADSSIRVDVDLLDRLMNLVWELVLARNQIVMRTSQDEDSALNAPVQQLNLITAELQEGVMKTRLQPIGNICSKFPRVVRDLSAKCGKKVRLQMEGQETELDRTIIEAIKDPLTHIIRNSVDHGIETPEERVAAGKPDEGRLLIRAFHEGGQVIIEIADDGSGIDAENMRKWAVQKGIITEEEASGLSPKESINLIFRAGFSSKEETTSVSGRGVGMDVVRTNIEKIGGNVDLQTTPGRGTVLKLEIPLTLAIIPALIVRSGGDRYAIPQVSLLELVRLDGEVANTSIEMVHGAPVYRLRGDLLPLVYLHDTLHLGSEHRPSSHNGTGAAANGQEAPEEEAGVHGHGDGNDAVNIVVLRAENSHFGLVVDEVLDTEEIVVKPLSGQVKSIQAFAGATVAGDGRVALILDVLGLAQQSKVVSEIREDNLGEVDDEVGESETTRRSLLVFAVGEKGRFAMPLSQVARLEEIPTDSIEYSGRRRIVQYRGEIMRLLWVSEVLELGDGKVSEGADLQVVVYSHRGRSVGLVVDRIIDVIDEVVEIEDRLADAGSLGSAVVQGQVTDILDAEAVISAFELSHGVVNGGPPTLQESIFARLGGAKMIHLAVAKFNELVLEDTELAPFFEDVDVDSLKLHQEAFLADAFGGPERYSGRPMKAAHADLVIEQLHFDLVVEYLASAMASLNVGPDLIADIVAIVTPLAEDIVTAVPALAT